MRKKRIKFQPSLFQIRQIMPKLEKIEHTTESNLIRVHPKRGGLTIDYGAQHFHGVNADLFFGLDLHDFSQTYHITRKFNISIAINPSYCSAEAFLAFVTKGDLEKTKKCELHGDKDTGLRAEKRLLELLSPGVFDVDGVRYVYDSIGVACNNAYKPVAHRTGNDFKNSSNHFEIKFRRDPEGALPHEYLCLNIHLMKETSKPFGKAEAMERLKQGIGLFYAELGLRAAHTLRTDLKSALTVTLGNFEVRGFSCKHEESLAVLFKYHEAKRYTRLQPHQTDGSLKEKPKSAPGFFSPASDDFPPLSAIGKPKQMDAAGSKTSPGIRANV